MSAGGVVLRGETHMTQKKKDTCHRPIRDSIMGPLARALKISESSHDDLFYPVNRLVFRLLGALVSALVWCSALLCRQCRAAANRRTG